MSIKNSFIRAIKDLMSNVQPKPDASEYYRDLANVEADLIADYASCFEELEEYEGLTIPKGYDASVLEGIKEKLKNNTKPELINGLCVGVDCPEYLCCEDCIFSKDHRLSLIRYLGIDRTDAQVQELPKLTVEVFDHPDCPTWAKYAGLNKNGRVIFYEDKKSPGVKADIGFFDASDWQNSLIERPKKQLPDWVCEGALAWDKQAEEYVHVVSVTDHEVQFDGGTYCTVAPEDVAESYDQAFERPFNEQEMMALVGKVLLHKTSRNASLVTGFTPATEINGLSDCTVHVFGRDYTDGDLMRDCLIDGSPCKVYEHLNEKGEKVK